MKILVDVDGVTVDMVTKILKAINWEFGTFYRYKDIRDWNFFSEGSNYDLLTNTQKQFTRTLLDTPGFCRELELIPHVNETLSKLVQHGHEVTWLTAPWKSSETWIDDRREMLLEKLAHVSSDIVFSWNKEETPGDILIDDSPEFIKKWLTKNSGRTLLFRQPWNEDFGVKHNFTFLDSWKDLNI